MEDWIIVLIITLEVEPCLQLIAIAYHYIALQSPYICCQYDAEIEASHRHHCYLADYADLVEA